MFGAASPTGSRQVARAAFRSFLPNVPTMPLRAGDAIRYVAAPRTRSRGLTARSTGWAAPDLRCCDELIERADGLMTVQDMGRPGHLSQGLPRGGAMDRLALIEAAALLGLAAPQAAVREMAGAGGVFAVSAPTRVALTGAPMRATLDGAPAGWHRTHLLVPGRRLVIGGADAGVYGYLTPAGSMKAQPWLDSRSAHLTIGIGGPDRRRQAALGRGPVAGSASARHRGRGPLCRRHLAAMRGAADRAVRPGQPLGLC